MKNQLIVYAPKKNIKKIILRIFLGIFISLLIFILAAFGSAYIFIKFKWDKTKSVDLQTTNITIINPDISKNSLNYLDISDL